jgi:aquaporin Z
MLASGIPDAGIGLLGVSLAFGLTVLTMAYAIGHISDCHLNPAVSIGLWAGYRFPAKALLLYIVAQVIGGIVAGGVLYLIDSGNSEFDIRNGFACNGYGEHSIGGYSLTAALVTGVVMTMMFLVVILDAIDKRTPGVCTGGYRPVPDLDSPDQYPGHANIGQPRTGRRRGVLYRRSGSISIETKSILQVVSAITFSFIRI